MIANGKTNWLECIPWDGNRTTLPMDMIISVPGVSITQLIKPGTSGPDIKIDEERFNNLVQAYGRKCILIRDSNGKQLSRWDWKAKYGTDGLLLYAISRRL